MALSAQDRDILDFEASWWTRPGAKSTAIRERLKMSPTCYYRRLSELVDTVSALEHAPLVVHRLRRRRRDLRRGKFETTVEHEHPRP